MLIALLVIVIAALVALYSYLTRCKKCGSWLNFEDVLSHYDEHQHCRWERRIRECSRCHHREFFEETRAAPGPNDLQFRRRS